MNRERQSISATATEALRLFFVRPDLTGSFLPVSDPVIARLASLFEQLGDAPRTGSASPAELLNALLRECPSGELGAELECRLFDALIDHRVLPQELLAESHSANTRFLLANAAALLEGAARIPVLLSESERRRTMPAALALFQDLVPTSETALAGRLAQRDRFRRNRAFRFHRGTFTPDTVGSAKPVGRFWGFPSVRALFADHFDRFAAGQSNLPLLIHSLPGYGKTSLTVSYTLDRPGLVLILPSPETLERGWSELMAQLAARPDHRFVVFFDDIDPREVNWYEFRTNVGGAFSPPENVMPVLAANYEFPASILSRGRKVSFPVFDELRCMEMVEDFLGTFGVRRPPRNLVSLIAADYTEEFGQKKFTELSPRSLTRYLKLYENDPVKRKTIAELSFGPMITRPDAELFYEFNIELMRSLYGEEYIQRLLKERLNDLG